MGECEILVEQIQSTSAIEAVTNSPLITQHHAAMMNGRNSSDGDMDSSAENPISSDPPHTKQLTGAVGAAALTGTLLKSAPLFPPPQGNDLSDSGMKGKEEEKGEIKQKGSKARKYYCEFCGLCRSKNSLITSHIRSTHQKGLKDDPPETSAPKERSPKPNICERCGIGFRKPAYLRQHMLSHSLERRFRCPEDKCPFSYRRKDHLTRHMRSHRPDSLLECTVPGCGAKFPYKANMTRHVQKVHRKEKRPGTTAPRERLLCPEPGCGKLFLYPSRLRHHLDVSHLKVESVEVLCPEPGCLKFFADNSCLRAHARACHRRIKCKICGAKLLKTSFWSHSRLHASLPRTHCSVEGCSRTFSSKANMSQHVRAAHLNLRPFFCRLPDCRQRFSFRHVRDRHEKVGIHLHTQGDFEERDALFRSKESRGGLKRKRPTVQMLMRKLVAAPVAKDALNYIKWTLSEEVGPTPGPCCQEISVR